MTAIAEWALAGCERRFQYARDGNPEVCARPCRICIEQTMAILRAAKVPSERMHANGVIALIDAGLDGPNGVGHSDNLACWQANLDAALREHEEAS